MLQQDSDQKKHSNFSFKVDKKAVISSSNTNLSKTKTGKTAKQKPRHNSKVLKNDDEGAQAITKER